MDPDPEPVTKIADLTEMLGSTTLYSPFAKWIRIRNSIPDAANGSVSMLIRSESTVLFNISVNKGLEPKNVSNRE
jgi:hypothetical protein